MFTMPLKLPSCMFDDGGIDNKDDPFLTCSNKLSQNLNCCTVVLSLLSRQDTSSEIMVLYGDVWF